VVSKGSTSPATSRCVGHNLSRISTYEKRSTNTFRIRTYENGTCNPRRISTYKKAGEGVADYCYPSRSCVPLRRSVA
jgi:hypothetical protein